MIPCSTKGYIDSQVGCRASNPYQEPQPTTPVYAGPSILAANVALPQQSESRRLLADTASDDTVSSWVVVFSSAASASDVQQFCSETIGNYSLSCANIYTAALMGFSCKVHP